MRALRLGFLLALAALAATAQMTVQQVVANTLRVRGGAGHFAAIHSFHFTGALDFGGGKGAGLEVWGADRPARIRVEVKLPAGTLVQGYDGKAAWQIDPGATTAHVLAGAAANQVEDQALNFLDLAADGDVKKELAGAGTLDGRSYVQVRFTLPTGDAFVQYFDTKTWLAFHEEYPGGVEEISDYRTVDGIRLPFRYVSGPVGRPGVPLVRDHVELGTPIAADKFELPKS